MRGAKRVAGFTHFDHPAMPSATSAARGADSKTVIGVTPISILEGFFSS